MQVLLLSDNHKVGAFIKQGFHYENLYFDLLLLDQNYVEIKFHLNKYKIILLNLTRPENLSTYFNDLHEYLIGKIVYLLVDQYGEELAEYSQNGKIQEIFIKPLQFKYIASKLRADLYNYDSKLVKEMISFRDIKINLETRDVWFKNKKLALRNKEFALLYFFLLNPGKILSRMNILENVWDANANIFTNTVDVHISRLRKLLRTNASEQPYIQTIPCSGYMFI